MVLLTTPQPSNAQEQDPPEKTWRTTIGTCAMYPHETELKNFFGSYFGIQAETQKNINKDFSIAVNGTLGLSNKTKGGYTCKANIKEMAALGQYSLGTEKSRFTIGIGPKISLMKLTAKDSGGNSGSEKYSGLGYFLQMKYSTKVGDKLALFAKFGYSDIKCSEYENFNLGTTNVAVGLEF